jgi:protoporphyrin/coproporphyrin ferrochelatase
MRKRVGIICFQLGGPDSPSAVEPFLYNLFCDPGIIPLGPLGGIFRKPLARYISRTRSQEVSKHYAEIGGQSPIRLLTERQARKLEAALASSVDATVFVAMRYWHPLTAAVVAAVNAAPLDSLVLLPLYPQYSFATTRSSLQEWERLYHPVAPAPPAHLIEYFYDHPLYIEAVVDRIELALSHFTHPDKVHLVFSAHGLPQSLIAKGDPYQKQIHETVRLVMQDGRWPNAHTLCYQSKVGRQKWLAPALEPTIADLAQRGEKQLLVIPISFVTEHIETLHEINIEAREYAASVGIQQFEMMPAVGDSARFIGALADLVLRAAGVENPQPAHAGGA